MPSTVSRIIYEHDIIITFNTLHISHTTAKMYPFHLLKESVLVSPRERITSLFSGSVKRVVCVWKMSDALTVLAACLVAAVYWAVGLCLYISLSSDFYWQCTCSNYPSAGRLRLFIVCTQKPQNLHHFDCLTESFPWQDTCFICVGSGAGSVKEPIPLPRLVRLTYVYWTVVSAVFLWLLLCRTFWLNPITCTCLE